MLFFSQNSVIQLTKSPPPCRVFPRPFHLSCASKCFLTCSLCFCLALLSCRGQSWSNKTHRASKGNSWKICWFPMQSVNQTLEIKTFGEFKGRNGSLRIARNGRQKYVEVHSDIACDLIYFGTVKFLNYLFETSGHQFCSNLWPWTSETKPTID